MKVLVSKIPVSHLKPTMEVHQKERVLNDLRQDVYENEDFLFDCARESLSRWTRKQLEKYLNPDGE